VPDLSIFGSIERLQNRETRLSFTAYAIAMRRLLGCVEARNVHVFHRDLGAEIAQEFLGRDQRIRSVMITRSPPVKLEPNSLFGIFFIACDGVRGKAANYANNSLELPRAEPLDQ
jgi:hypothetical protein